MPRDTTFFARHIDSGGRGYNVQAQGAVGDGTTDDRAALAAADALGPAEGSPGKTYKVNTDLTLTNGWRPNRSTLKPANAVTVTISGHVSAGLYPWIDTSLGGAVVFSAGAVGEVVAEWWGAKGDDTVDCGAAMLAAAAASPAGGTVALGSRGTYKSTVPWSPGKALALRGQPTAGYQSASQLHFVSCNGLVIDTGYCTVRDLHLKGSHNPGDPLVTDTAPAHLAGTGAAGSFTVTVSPAWTPNALIGRTVEIYDVTGAMIAAGPQVVTGNTANVASFSGNATGGVALALDVFGNCGIKINAGSTNTRLENVQVYYFDTGKLALEGVYGSNIGCKFIYNEINVAGKNFGTWESYSDCHLRNAFKHGVYFRNASATMNQCLFEGNGVSGLNFTDPTMVRYGLKFEGTGGAYEFTDCWFNDVMYVGKDVEVTINGFRHETAFRVFGPGSPIMKDHFTSENRLPADVAVAWTPQGNTTLTATSTDTRVQASVGTNEGAHYFDVGVGKQIEALDILGYVYSVDVKVVAGFADAGFGVVPDITIGQISGRQDAANLIQNYDPTIYNWSDGLYHTINFYGVPRYGAGVYLDDTEHNLERITAFIAFVSGDFSAHPLDAYVKNPRLTLFTRKRLSQLARPTLSTVTLKGTTTVAGLLDASAAGAGQIKFPAAQNASADANTLDDYEEGPWTPADASGTTGGPLTLTASGTYTKIGRVVYCTMKVVYPATADTHNTVISGLPYAASATPVGGGGPASCDVGAYTPVSVVGGDTKLNFRNASGVALTNANMSGHYWYGSFVYVV